MNLAETVKKQTDRILRQRSLNQTEGVVVSGVASGVGAPAPTVNNPPVDLTAHKASADHDGRYYTEAEVEALIDALTFDLTTHKASADHDGRYYTEAEVEALIDALTFADTYRKTFDNVDTIDVVHNLGRRPIVQVQGSAITAYGAGNYGDGSYGGISPYTVLNPSQIEHSLDSNTVTVTLASEHTGEVICVG